MKYPHSVPLSRTNEELLPSFLNSQVAEWPILITTTCRWYVTSASSLLGKRCCSSRTSFHLVPTLERITREGVSPGKSSSFVRERGTLCGYFIVILHSTVQRSLPALRQVDFTMPHLR